MLFTSLVEASLYSTVEAKSNCVVTCNTNRSVYAEGLTNRSRELSLGFFTLAFLIRLVQIVARFIALYCNRNRRYNKKAHDLLARLATTVSLDTTDYKKKVVFPIGN